VIKLPHFASSRMDGLNLFSILNLPFVLDCLPPFVRKFWSPLLVAWKYVKTYGQELFNYGALGRFVRASQVTKIIHFGCACSRNSSFSFALYCCDAQEVCGP